MAHDITVELVIPSDPSFVGACRRQRSRVYTSVPDWTDNEPCSFVSMRNPNRATLDRIDADLTLQILQRSFVALLVETQNVHGRRDQNNQLTCRETALVDILELRARKRLNSIDLGFRRLSHMRYKLINAMRGLKNAKSVVGLVPPELWSRIFIYAIAPFGAVAVDAQRGRNTSSASLWGTGFCCPETLLLVCRRWRAISLDTPQLWVNVSKAHVAIPTLISSAISDAVVQKSAKTIDSKQLLARLLRYSLSEDRLLSRACAYAVRSGDALLYVDLRHTTFPSNILGALQPHFGRVRVLYIDSQEPEIVEYLDSCRLPLLETLSLTAPPKYNPFTRFGSRPPPRITFPRIFNETNSLVNLRIGFPHDFDSPTFKNISWGNLTVLEIDRVFNSVNILRILRNCSKLRDLIVSCPFVEGRPMFSTLRFNSTDMVQLSHLQSLHYRCDAEYDADLSLLRYLDLPEIKVLSIHAEVDGPPGAWLETRAAEDFLMQKMFCGDWPGFSTLELLHGDASGLRNMQLIKIAMEQYIINNVPLGSQKREVLICGPGITEEHEDRFNLCTTEGIGGPERVRYAAQQIDNWV